MKRFWKILSSRDGGRELLCWAADSKVGAAFVILLWIVAHLLLAFIFTTGTTGLFDRRYDPYWFWLDAILFALCVLFIDCLVLLRIAHERRRPKA